MKIFNRFDKEKILYKDNNTSIRKSVENALKRKVNLSVADLSGADLSGANLAGANLAGADLSGANLTGANLEGVNLSVANLPGSSLPGVKMSVADLSGANMTGANMTWADLSRADLTGANLTGADLCGSTGNSIEIKTIQTEIYIVNIVEKFEYIQIGCERNTIERWFNFTDREILEMDGKKALKWWKKWKPILVAILEHK